MGAGPVGRIAGPLPGARAFDTGSILSGIAIRNRSGNWALQLLDSAVRLVVDQLNPEPVTPQKVGIMSTAHGTTSTGTDVQVAVATQASNDAALIAAYVDALTAANKSGGLFVKDMSRVAVAVIDLHDSRVWERTLTDGKPYTSAKAFYADLNRQDRFPVLHKLLREELLEELYSAHADSMPGVNELAALIGVNPAQITRTRQAIEAKAAAEAAAAEAEAKAAAEAEAIEAAAAEAAAEAAAAGKSEAEVEAAAEAVRRFAEAEAEATAKAEAEAAAKAAAEAEATAEAKAAAKAAKVFTTAVEGVRNHFHIMTAEDQASVAKLAADLNGELAKLTALIEAANAPKADAPKPKPRGQRAAS